MDNRGGASFSTAGAFGAGLVCAAGPTSSEIDPNRLSDILEFSLPKVADHEIEPPLDLAVRVFRQADRPGLGDAFEARGDVDAIAHEVAVALFDYISEMNADAEFDAALGRQAGVALGKAMLQFDCAAYSVDHAAKLDRWRRRLCA